MGKFRNRGFLVTDPAAIEWLRRFDYVEPSIREALAKSSRNQPSGLQDLTKYALKKMFRVTKGATEYFDFPTLKTLFGVVDICDLLTGVHFLPRCGEQILMPERPIGSAWLEHPKLSYEHAGKHERSEVAFNLRYSLSERSALAHLLLYPNGISPSALQSILRRSGKMAVMVEQGLASLQDRGFLRINDFTGYAQLEGVDLRAELAGADPTAIQVAAKMQVAYFIEFEGIASGNPLDLLQSEVRRIKPEMRNLEAALCHAIQIEDSSAAQMFAAALAKEHLRSEGYEVGLSYLDLALNAFRRHPEVHCSELYLLKEWLKLRMAKLKEALACCQIAELRSEDNRLAILQCQYLYGAVFHAELTDEGARSARQHFEAARRLALQQGKRELEPRFQLNLAMIDRDQHKLKSAAHRTEVCIDLADSRDVELLTAAYTMRGEIYLHRGEYVDSIKQLNKALETSKKQIIPMRHYCVLRKIVEANLDQDCVEVAKSYDVEAIEFADLTDNQLFKAEARFFSAMVRGWESRTGEYAMQLLLEGYKLESQKQTAEEEHFGYSRLFFEVLSLLSVSGEIRSIALGISDQYLRKFSETGRNLRKRHSSLHSKLKKDLMSSYRHFYNIGNNMTPTQINHFCQGLTI